MVYESTKDWLDSLALSPDAQVLAGLALRLALSFDAEGNTSTAAELRKTVLEIKRIVGDGEQPVDPIAALLQKRG